MITVAAPENANTIFCLRVVPDCLAKKKSAAQQGGPKMVVIEARVITGLLITNF